MTAPRQLTPEDLAPTILEIFEVPEDTQPIEYWLKVCALEIEGALNGHSIAGSAGPGLRDHIPFLHAGHIYVRPGFIRDVVQLNGNSPSERERIYMVSAIGARYVRFRVPLRSGNPMSEYAWQLPLDGPFPFPPARFGIGTAEEVYQQFIGDLEATFRAEGMRNEWLSRPSTQLPGLTRRSLLMNRRISMVQSDLNTWRFISKHKKPGETL